ncbi:uncharacterized protein C11orf53 homolog isoform X2 [Alosa sapidissima]|uniref:uncharacterized protein C11orf53 homolog isoform X2 n=1 Tax=Alosa sapidissima TaxID=34773 RepID=UPI001C09BEEA|nr:uncharacterized protein C11orf53 homolog isoform X2 [Alosa sapidissima]
MSISPNSWNNTNAMETDYSKRVYQGVRVKHTVKDLLAEKRSRQTNVPRFNAGTNPSQAAFVQMPGYYSMRRPFLQDSELCHPMKQYSTDTYSSSLGGKAFSYDHPSSYPFIDSYYPSDSFGDYRTASTYSTSGGSLFPPSSLPPLLPPMSAESSTSHLLLRDAWDQPTEVPVSQPDVLCPEGTTPVTGSPSMATQDSESASTYRMPTSRTGGSMSSSSQPYPVQPLEEVPYPATSYAPVSNFSLTPYMTVPGDLAVAKMPTMSSEETGDGSVAQSDTSTWAKDDGNGSWLSYETRRAF